MSAAAGAGHRGGRPRWDALVPWGTYAGFAAGAVVAVLFSIGVMWLYLTLSKGTRPGVDLPVESMRDWWLNVLLLIPLWGLDTVASEQLRRNTPAVAWLVPDHPRLVRGTLWAGVGVTVAVLVIVVAAWGLWHRSGPQPDHVAGLLSRCLLASAFVIAAARLDGGWVISSPLAFALLVPMVSLEGLRPWWPLLEGRAALPALMLSAVLLWAVVTSAVGRGDAAHRRAQRRREGPPEQVRLSAALRGDGDAPGERAGWLERLTDRWFLGMAARRIMDTGNAWGRVWLVLGRRGSRRPLIEAGICAAGLIALYMVTVPWHRPRRPGGAWTDAPTLETGAVLFVLGTVCALAVFVTLINHLIALRESVAEQRLVTLAPGVHRGTVFRRRFLGRVVGDALLMAAVFGGLVTCAVVLHQARGLGLAGALSLLARTWDQLDGVAALAVSLPLWPLLMRDWSEPPPDPCWAWLDVAVWPVGWVMVLMLGAVGWALDVRGLTVAGGVLTAYTSLWAGRHARAWREPWPACRRGTQPARNP